MDPTSFDRKLVSAVLKAGLYPIPLRTVLFRRLVKRFKLGSYRDRLRWDAVDRPWYGQCVYHAAAQARALGIDRLSVIEFGVAGGNGLLCLEDHAIETEKALGVTIDIYGFDAGTGLPSALDYRDLPYAWPPGSFEMDREKLLRRLTRTRLIIGDVRDSVRDFFAREKPAPLGAVIFDLDLYSSTTAALKILDTAPEHTLPRLRCYFDDMYGYDDTLFNDCTGVRLAIDEFNRNHQANAVRLSPSNSFFGAIPQYWHFQMYVCHYFTHPGYNKPLAAGLHQLKLE